MAMVKYGGHIITVKGKVAGNYFQRSKYGNHIKSCPRRVKSQKDTLRATRKYFTTVKNAWCNKVWTIAEIENWNAYNNRHPSVSSMGYNFILTHQLCFIKFNLYRVRNGLPVSFVPPREIL